MGRVVLAYKCSAGLRAVANMDNVRFVEDDNVILFGDGQESSSVARRSASYASGVRLAGSKSQSLVCDRLPVSVEIYRTPRVFMSLMYEMNLSVLARHASRRGGAD